MDWILQCLLCFILTTPSTTQYNQHNGYSHVDFPSEPNHNYEFIGPVSQYHNGKMNYRSTDRSNARSADRSNARSSQRMNERSIAVDSGIQRVQELERKRLQSREDALPRTENGSYKIVNTNPKIYPSITNRNGQTDDDRPSNNRDSVIFPGPTSQSRFIPEIPEECKRLGICSSIKNYPQELVDSIIEELGDQKERIRQVDVLQTPQIAQRFGGPAEENIELCNFKEEIHTPQAAETPKGDWYMILNQKDPPLQGFRSEICLPEGGACAPNIARFYDGYTASCKQKFVIRTMTALDDDGKILYNMPFKLPSCCACVASHSGKK